MANYAHRAGLAEIDRRREREFRARAFFIALVFTGSIPIAFVAPEIAPFFWLILFFDPADRGRRRR